MRCFFESLATVAIAIALGAAACEPAPESWSDTDRSLSAAGQVRSISYGELEPDLPGCLEALRQSPALSPQPSHVELLAVEQEPALSVLVVDGTQVCVDATEDLTFWLDTGRWPPDDGSSGWGVYYERRGFQHAGEREPSDRNSRGSASSTGDDVSRDDSDPLPPYPNPLVEQTRVAPTL